MQLSAWQAAWVTFFMFLGCYLVLVIEGLLVAPFSTAMKTYLFEDPIYIVLGLIFLYGSANLRYQEKWWKIR